MQEQIPIENADESQKTIVQKDSWSKNEALALIDTYKSRHEEFNSTRRRRNVWENISNDLLGAEIVRSAKCCEVKWKNMVRTYRAVKEAHKKTGRGTKRFLFFNELDELIGNTPTSYVTKLEKNETPIEKVGEEIEILHPKSSKSDTGSVDSLNSEIPNCNKEEVKKRKRVNDWNEFLKLKKDSLIKKNEYLQRKAAMADKERKKKEEREERKLQLKERQLDIEERKVKALELYLAKKK